MQLKHKGDHTANVTLQREGLKVGGCLWEATLHLFHSDYFFEACRGKLWLIPTTLTFLLLPIKCHSWKKQSCSDLLKSSGITSGAPES